MNRNYLPICRVIKTKPHIYSAAIQEIIEFRNIICIPTTEIFLPSVFIEAEGKKYIVPVPNLYSY